MKYTLKEALPLTVVAVLFVLLWGYLSLGMLMAWLYLGAELNSYGLLSIGVLLYGVGTLGYFFWALSDLDQFRQRVLFVLLIPIPIAICLLLEWLH